MARNPPAIGPAITARNVPSSSTPLPHESSFSGSSSGSSPYFDGPNSAACVLARNTAAASSQMFCSERPAVANTITPISIHFVPIVTDRLLYRSARYPPAIEKKMNGTANRPPITRMRKSCVSLLYTRFKMRLMTRNFRRLSLKAPWNWTTIKLQNPRRPPAPSPSRARAACEFISDAEWIVELSAMVEKGSAAPASPRLPPPPRSLSLPGSIV